MVKKLPILLVLPLFVVSPLLKAQSDSTASVRGDSTALPAQDSTAHVLPDSTTLAAGSLPVEEENPSTGYLPVSGELNFIRYLITNGQYDDAFFVLQRLENSGAALSHFQLDSVEYYLGWVNYFNQRFHPAIASFAKVDSASPLFAQAVFYRFICHVYEEELAEAGRVLSGLVVEGDPKLEHLRELELAGLALLQRDFKAYERHAQELTGQYYLFAAEEEGLKNHYLKLSTYKKKSPLVAALLSALVPGLGKFYVGYRGLPFGALMTNLPLAAVAVESLIIAGLLSPQFIILGSVFAAFYIGNIWGSALSVNAKKREDYAEIDHNVLFDMHVALRRVLD